MLIDGRQVEQDSFNCDVCVVGSGAAGITIALELERSGLSVVLLEAGGEQVTDDSQNFYNAINEGVAYNPKVSRLRCFGGTTGHWAGFCAPLDDSDFEVHHFINKSGWPINRSELDRFYRKANNILELGEYNYDPDYWVDSNRGAGRLELDGELADKVWHFSPPVRFGNKYKEHLKNSRLICLLLNAPVVDISLVSGKKAVNHVRVKAGEKNFFVEAKKFVLACGGIENPRLLLNANKQLEHGLGNEHDLVGRYFQEHPTLHHCGDILLTGKNSHSNLYYNSRKKRTNMANFFTIPGEVRKQRQLANTAFYTGPPQKYGALDNEVRGYLNELYGDLDERDNFKRFAFMTEHQPNWDSRIYLADEADQLGMKKAKVDLQLSSSDYDSMRRSIEYFSAAISKSQVGKVKVKNPEIFTDTKKALNAQMGWGNHHIGTTKMSDSPSDGVVDKDCRVHSVENLYIAGSSVFPTSGCANPTFSIVALAARLAEHLSHKTAA